MITTAGVERSAPLGLGRDRFHTWMALSCLAVAVIGFAPTYWLPVASGTVSVSPLTHLHGLLFSAWLVFFVAQAALVSAGRQAYHRELGVAGVAIATAMLFVGLAVAMHRVRELESAGLGEAARRFSIVPVTGICLFALLVGLAIRFRHQRDIHKRLMLVATVSLMQAAVGRLVRMVLASSAELPAGALPPPPLVAFSVGPALLSDVLLVAAMVHDRRSTGRVHAAYWLAGGALLAVQLLRVPVSATDAWMRVMEAFMAFAP